MVTIHIEDVSNFPFIGHRGEASLKASKEMNDQRLDDAGRRSNGSNVDGIITHVDTGMELCIVEVSGPPAKNDHTHYIQDRKKIAINLRKMYKKILAKYATSNPSKLKDLVLLGVHMYSKYSCNVGRWHKMANSPIPFSAENRLYIYGLTMPALGIFSFSTIHYITIPNETIHASKDLPEFVFTLWSLALRLEIAANVLNSSALDYDSDGSIFSITSSTKSTPTHCVK